MDILVREFAIGVLMSQTQLLGYCWDVSKDIFENSHSATSPKLSFARLLI